MYVIMVYDFNKKRVSKVLKISCKYFDLGADFALQGEITNAKLGKLKVEID